MSYDTLGAIQVLKDGLKPDRSHTFVQADALVSRFLLRDVPSVELSAPRSSSSSSDGPSFLKENTKKLLRRSCG